ncbi:MAG: iron-sulfur cluster assembly scaffold protein [Promethearchaeota archaeon]
MKKADEDFEKFVKNLQNEINQEEMRIFSKNVIEEYHNPKNLGKMNDSNAHAIIKGPCGDTMEIYLKIKNNIIIESSFFTDGCGPSIACGSKLTTLLKNKSIIKIKKITPKDLLDALDGLPLENEHCALLAVNTLHKALDNFK